MLRYLLTGLDRLRQSQAIVGVLVISVLMNVLVFPYQQLFQSLRETCCASTPSDSVH
jgi:hypothetical protein